MTLHDVLEKAEAQILSACPAIGNFVLAGPDAVRLAGMFSTHELRTIVAALEALQAPLTAEVLHDA